MKNKLYLNGLNKIADAFYNEILKINSDIVSNKDKTLIKNANKTQNNIDDFLHKSNVINLIKNRKDKNAYKNLNYFLKK